MQARVLSLLFGALAIAVIAAGCGADEATDRDAGSAASNEQNASSGSEGSGAAGPANGQGATSERLATTELSKAQYVKKANALCTEVRDETARLVAAFAKKNEGKIDSRQEAIEIVREEIWLPQMEARLEGLRELGAPRGEEEEVEAIVAAYEDVVDQSRELQEDPTSGPSNRESERFGRLARKYKLIECTYG